jgi:hypothetical protein
VQWTWRKHEPGLQPRNRSDGPDRAAELEARQIRRSIEHARGEADKRVLNRQLAELKEQIQLLRSRLP